MKYYVVLFILGCSVGLVFFLNQDNTNQVIEVHDGLSGKQDDSLGIDKLPFTGDASGEVMDKQDCQNADLSCERVWRLSYNIIDTRGPRNDPKGLLDDEKFWFEYNYTGHLYTGSDSSKLLLGWEDILKTKNIKKINSYLDMLIEKGLTIRLMPPGISSPDLDSLVYGDIFLGMENVGTGYIALLYNDNARMGPGDGDNLFYLSMYYDESSQKFILNNVELLDNDIATNISWPSSDFWIKMDFPKEMTCHNGVCKYVGYGITCEGFSQYDIHSPCLQAMRDLLTQGKEYLTFGDTYTSLLKLFPSSLSDG